MNWTAPFIWEGRGRVCFYFLLALLLEQQSEVINTSILEPSCLSLWLHACLSLLGLPLSKYPKLSDLNTRNLFSQFWRLEVPDQDVSRVGCLVEHNSSASWTCLPAFNLQYGLKKKNKKKHLFSIPRIDWFIEYFPLQFQLTSRMHRRNSINIPWWNEGKNLARQEERPKERKRRGLEREQRREEGASKGLRRKVTSKANCWPISYFQKLEIALK